MKAATARKPKLRYPAGKQSHQARSLRRFMPEGLVDGMLRRFNGFAGQSQTPSATLAPLQTRFSANEFSVDSYKSIKDLHSERLALQRRRASARSTEVLHLDLETAQRNCIHRQQVNSEQEHEGIRCRKIRKGRLRRCSGTWPRLRAARTRTRYAHTVPTRSSTTRHEISPSCSPVTAW